MSLLAHMVRFSRELSAAGIPVDTANMIDLCRCFSYVDISHKRDFYAAARANLVSSHEDFPRFDQVFEAFWQKTVSQVVDEADSDDTHDEDSVRKKAKEQERIPDNLDED